MSAAKTLKQPVSVLVVLHDGNGNILLIERADRASFWQSVTGSIEAGETLAQTALREVQEETGLDASQYGLSDWQQQNRYEIYPKWRHRYPDGVTHNTEHVLSLLLPAALPVRLAEGEHLRYCWLPWQDAAAKVFSPSNADAIRCLPERLARLRPQPA